MSGNAELDWNDVRVFLAAACDGSLAGAGRSLALSQATAGRRLKRLEAALGARLFDRLPNSLVLSSAGTEFLDDARAMADAAAALVRQAGARSGLPADVRVSATTSVSLFLAGHIGVLAAAGNDIGARITVLASRLQADIAGGEAEIALRMRRLPTHGALVSRRLGRVAFAPYASRAYWGARDANEPWRGAAIIGLPESVRSPSQSRWLDDLAAAREATVHVRLGEVTMRHHAARDGHGVTLLPCFLGDADPALARLMGPPAELTEDVHLLVRDDIRAVPVVRAAIGALTKLFRARRVELAGGRASPQQTGLRTAAERQGPETHCHRDTTKLRSRACRNRSRRNGC